jgi:hypothetical protein
MPKAPETQDIAREVTPLLKGTRRQKPQATPSFIQMGLTVGTRIRLTNNHRHVGDEIKIRIGTIEAIYPRYVLVKTDRYRITVQAHDVAIGKFGIEVLDGKEWDMPRRDGPTQLETARSAHTQEDYEKLRSQGFTNQSIAMQWQIHQGTLITLRKEWGLPVQSFSDPVTPDPVLEPVAQGEAIAVDPLPIGAPGALADSADINLTAPIDRPVSIEDDSLRTDDIPVDLTSAGKIIKDRDGVYRRALEVGSRLTTAMMANNYVGTKEAWSWKFEPESPGATCPLPGILITNDQIAEWRSVLLELASFKISITNQLERISGDLHHLTSDFREHDINSAVHWSDEDLGSLRNDLNFFMEESRRLLKDPAVMKHVLEPLTDKFVNHRHQVGPGHWSDKPDNL